MKRKLSDYNLVAFDLETANGRGSGSLDPRDGFIALMQLKMPNEEARLIDPLADNFQTEELPALRKILSDPKNLIIGHNIKFDYKWLAYNGLYIRNLFDTQVASEIYYNGTRKVDNASATASRFRQAYTDDNADVEPLFTNYTDFIEFKETKSSRFSHSFSACMLRELDIALSKAEQNSDWTRRPLTAEQEEYALWDVLETVELARRLYTKLEAMGLTDVFWLEMDVQPAIVLKEVAGVLVDKEAWARQAEEVREHSSIMKRNLEHELGLHLAEQREDRGGLFGVVPVEVNINSNDVIVENFGLPNAQAATLREFADTNPFLRKILEYKGLSKQASTYGPTYLRHIGDDSRLRSNFSQTRTVTGRLNSASPNLQNCPPNMIKSLIRPSEGHSLVAIDFSTVELRILAYLSGDEAFIDACNSMDMHSQNARRLFGYSDDEPVTKEQRDIAKVVSFSVPYGTTAWGLFARGFGESVEECQKIIDDFYRAFPRVEEFLRRSADNASEQGITRDAMGRVRRYDPPPQPLNYRDKKMQFMALRNFLTTQEIDPKLFLTYTYEEAIEYSEEFSKHFSQDDYADIREVHSYERTISAIRREGQNMAIQATSADITKLAMSRAYRYLRDTGYGFLTLSIHDSIFYELKNEYFGIAHKDIVEIMESSGPAIVPNIITPVDSEFGWVVKQKCSAHGEDVHIFNQRLVDDLPVYLTDEELNDEVQRLCDKEH